MTEDLHFIALEKGTEAALVLIRDLPDTDVTFEIESFLAMNLEILDDLITGSYFMEKTLQNYILYCDQIEAANNLKKD